MEIIYFTLVGIILYLLSDWIVRQIEARVGHTLNNRSLIFFAILLILALASFAVIRAYTGA